LLIHINVCEMIINGHYFIFIRSRTLAYDIISDGTVYDKLMMTEPGTDYDKRIVWFLFGLSDYQVVIQASYWNLWARRLNIFSSDVTS
jgi:hypothetical protein